MASEDGVAGQARVGACRMMHCHRKDATLGELGVEIQITCRSVVGSSKKIEVFDVLFDMSAQRFLATLHRHQLGRSYSLFWAVAYICSTFRH